MSAQPQFQRQLESVERLLRQVESTADPHLRASVQELLEAVMSLHSAGLERVLDLLRVLPDGEQLIQSIGRDGLVGSILVLHGVHPVAVDGRLAYAVDKVRTRLRSHDAQIELLNFSDGVVRHRSERG